LQIRATARLPRLLLEGDPSASAARLTSPIGLKQVSDQVIENSLAWNQWFPILRLAGVISVALGFTNLLPFPALDGGRIAFVCIEVLIRRRVAPRLERAIHAAGLVGLLSLMVFLIIQDLLHPLF
jgi:regulator of sigma E protease